MNMNKQSVITNSISSFMQNDSLNLHKIAAELRHNIRLILGVSGITFAFAFFHTLSLDQKYQTSALIQIQTNNANNMVSNMTIKSNAPSNLETQIALLKTRYILEPVVNKYALNISITPKYFPIFGKWVATYYHGEGVAKPFLWFNAYAWGGENVNINQLIVPDSLKGATLRLVADKNHTYQLFTESGTLLLAGKTEEKSWSKDKKTMLEVAKLDANPGTQFTINSTSSLTLANRLASNLRVIPIYGNDTTQNTGIFQLQLTGSIPDRIVKTLNAIVDYSIKRNAKQKTIDTQNTIDFLNRRLPEQKSNLEQAESALNQYHMKNTTLSMAMISRILLQDLTNLSSSIQKLKAQKAELSEIYTPEHPIIVAINEKEASLLKQIEAVKNEIRKFPDINQEEINLEREIKIKNSMYLSLLNSKQQVEIIKGGLTPDIVLLTDATPPSPVPQHKLLIMLGGFLVGVFLSSLVIIIKCALSKTIETASELEGELQIPVQSIVPYSRKQKQIEKTYYSGLSVLGSQASPLILAKREPDDITVESLRSLRVSMQIMSSASSHQIISIMSSLSNVGKSFITLNLAQVITDSGKRTLLIDADLRKGFMHQNLLLQKSNGLSEYLEGKANYGQIVQQVNDSLYFISCGSFTQQPSDLFHKQRFVELLQTVKTEFDQIIIDTPAILPTADSLLIAQHCDKKLFIVSAGTDTMTDVKQAIKKARSHGVEVSGLVFNHTKPLSTSKYSLRHAHANG